MLAKAGLRNKEVSIIVAHRGDQIVDEKSPKVLLVARVKDKFLLVLKIYSLKAWGKGRVTVSRQQ